MESAGPFQGHRGAVRSETEGHAVMTVEVAGSEGKLSLYFEKRFCYQHTPKFGDPGKPFGSAADAGFRGCGCKCRIVLKFSLMALGDCVVSDLELRIAGPF